MSRPSLVIYGIDGFCRQAAEIALQQGAFELAACIAPAAHVADFQCLLADAQSQLGPLYARGVTHAFFAFEDNRTRMRLAEESEALGFQLATLIHPTSTIARSAAVGRHVEVGPRASICVNARIEPHAVINTSAIIEHDNRIGPGAWIAPAVRLAGGVKIAEGVRLGIGACVIPGRTIGAWADVAPGAVVIRDVPALARVVGVPATVQAPSRFVEEQPRVAAAANIPVPA